MRVCVCVCVVAEVIPGSLFINNMDAASTCSCFQRPKPARRNFQECRFERRRALKIKWLNCYLVAPPAAAPPDVQGAFPLPPSCTRMWMGDGSFRSAECVRNLGSDGPRRPGRHCFFLRACTRASACTSPIRHLSVQMQARPTRTPPHPPGRR